MLTGSKYYTRKEFNKNVKNSNSIIMADTSLKKYDRTKHQRYEKLSYKNKVYLVRPNIHGITTAYIEIGEDQFVAVKKYIWILPILAGIVAILLAWTLRNSGSFQNIPVVGEPILDHTQEETTQEYMTIPGLKDIYILSENTPEINLINPKGNTVYFKYILSVNGIEIFETGFIEPDRMIKANLYNLLDKGSYNIDVSISTIDIETLTSCNSISLYTNVTILKNE